MVKPGPSWAKTSPVFVLSPNHSPKRKTKPRRSVRSLTNAKMSGSKCEENETSKKEERRGKRTKQGHVCRGGKLPTRKRRGKREKVGKVGGQQAATVCEKLAPLFSDDKCTTSLIGDPKGERLYFLPPVNSVRRRAAAGHGGG